jgi:hypothetical protein
MDVGSGLDDREIHVAIAKPRSNAPKKESRKAGPQGEKNSSQMTAESQDSAADGQAGAGPTAESQGGSKQPRSQRKKVYLDDLMPSPTL